MLFRSLKPCEMNASASSYWRWPCLRRSLGEVERQCGWLVGWLVGWLGGCSESEWLPGLKDCKPRNRNHHPMWRLPTLPEQFFWRLRLQSTFESPTSTAAEDGDTPRVSESMEAAASIRDDIICIPVFQWHWFIGLDNDTIPCPVQSWPAKKITVL